MSEQQWDEGDWTLHEPEAPALPASLADEPPMAALIHGRLAIWPQNWAAVKLFWELRFDWHLYPNGRFQRMDKGAMHSVMQMRQIKRTAMGDLLTQLQLMESAALGVFHDD